MGHGYDDEPRAGRALPERAFVSLAEALTWIAFGDALTVEELKAQVEGIRRAESNGTYERQHAPFLAYETVWDVPRNSYFSDHHGGLEKLERAWQRLRDEADRGTVKVRGRFTQHYLTEEAELADVRSLDANELETYSQFDVSKGGIRKPLSMPSVIWDDHPQSFEHEVRSRGDDKRARYGYLFVEVERAALYDMPRLTATSDLVAGGLCTANGERECREWLKNAFNADPQRKRPKLEFQDEALGLFAGRLTVRGFLRAWALVAKEADRSKPGRKS
jgi:hypothetical protein